MTSKSMSRSMAFSPVCMSSPFYLVCRLAPLHANYFFLPFGVNGVTRSVSRSMVFSPVRMSPPFYLVCSLVPIHANAPLGCLA